MPKYLDKKWINGKWRYFYDKVGKLGGSAKVSAIRASDSARRGAAAILKSAKAATYRRKIKNGKIGAPSDSWHRKHQRGMDKVNKSNWIHYAGRSDNARGMDRTGEGMVTARNKIAAKGKAYYKSNNAAIAANKKGKLQTEYYKNLQKKQAAAKAKKIRKQADLDRMTSGGSKSDRRALNLVSDYKEWKEFNRKHQENKKKAAAKKQSDRSMMTSGGSTSDRDALRKAAGKKKITANNKAIAANKKGKSQTEYYRDLQKKQAAAKARKKQADLDRMTSTSKSDASIFSNTPRRAGYLDLGIDKKGIHYRLNMGKKGKKKTKKGSRSGFSWSYK